MDPDQLKEHLTFAAELGVTGVSRDPDWRGVGSHFSSTAGADSGQRPAESAVYAENAQPKSIMPLKMTPDPTAADPAQALVSVREDIGDCTRCKLHTLGRTQIVLDRKSVV